MRNALTWLVVGLLAGEVLADQVLLSPSRDNTLYEEESGLLSNGAGDYFFAGRSQQGVGLDIRRGLIAFDLSADIPAGAVVNSATLTLRMSQTVAGAHAVSLHRVLADWGEGTSDAEGSEGPGGQSTPDSATWFHTFFDKDFWTTVGGDFAGTISASTTVGGNGTYTWSSPGMVQDIQAWVNDPSVNFGWLLRGNESAVPSAKRFNARENSSTPPTLLVNYTIPADFGACCYADGGCQLNNAAGCSGTSGSFQGIASSCSPNPCPQPTGACCLIDDSCVVDTADGCALLTGQYQGDDEPCTPLLCASPGACCFSGGSCSELNPATCADQDGSFLGSGVICEPDVCPLNLEPFVDALPIPAVAQPVIGEAGGAATYDIGMTEFTQQLHRDLGPTTVWGYDGTYPGPTIEARAFEQVTVRWRNDLRNNQGTLRQSHYLAVDLCPHGPNVNGSVPMTVVHLHGAHVGELSDGHPDYLYPPGSEDTYYYPNGQLATTLWYHDHGLGITRLNVYMGLAGFYLIRDDVEDALDLPAGDYEVPLVIQDRSFNLDGTWSYPETLQDHFFGDYILVNGKVWPYLEVDQGLYRFRMLNGSNARAYTLSLSNGASFQQIGTDGGLKATPETLSKITLFPSERADLVIDFSAYPAGTEIVLTNTAPAPYPGTEGVGVVPQVMKFIVTDQPGETTPIPDNLRPLEILAESKSVITRDFELRKESDPCAGTTWLINGLGWDDITEFPQLGTTEIWRFINPTEITHPMHVHLVQFQLLDRQVFELVDGEITLVGDPIPPQPEEVGWKDTIQVNPMEIVRIIARFDGFTGKFPYHCHILEHEDHEMMRQFKVVATCDDVSDCADADGNNIRDNNCRWWACVDGLCQDTDVPFADLGGQFGVCAPDGTADGNDRFHALNCFADVDSEQQQGYPCEDNPPDALNVDAGGPFGDCAPDGVCDGNDAFAALNAFAGTSSCTCPPTGSPTPEFPRPANTADVLLVPSRRTIAPGGNIEIDVYLESELSDLRGYQLHLESIGGAAGALELVDIAVRQASVLHSASRQPTLRTRRASRKTAAPQAGMWSAFNIKTHQMVAGMDQPGVAVRPGYLATFTYRATKNARGSFAVAIQADPENRSARTFLFPTTPGDRIEVATTPVSIKVAE